MSPQLVLLGKANCIQCTAGSHRSTAQTPHHCGQTMSCGLSMGHVSYRHGRNTLLKQNGKGATSNYSSCFMSRHILNSPKALTKVLMGTPFPIVLWNKSARVWPCKLPSRYRTSPTEPMVLDPSTKGTSQFLGPGYQEMRQISRVHAMPCMLRRARQQQQRSTHELIA